MAILREPVEQIISLYAHTISLDINGNLKNEYDKNKINKKDFFEWLKTEDICHNFQTNNFLFDEFFLKKDNPKSKLYVKIERNEKILEARKNRVNLFLNMKNINNRETEIKEKIFLDLGIKNEVPPPSKILGSFNPESKILYNQFNKAEKESIDKYNSIDSEFYRSINYF